jgi:hypothetical protein
MIASMHNQLEQRNNVKPWIARLLIGAVFCANLSAAIPFILFPERFVGGFELSGLPGEVSVRGLGITFLMWNATYLPILLKPQHFRILFLIVLAQQLIGLVGETVIWWNLPDGYAALSGTGLRFILFDGLGLLALLIAFVLSLPPNSNNKRTHRG